MKIHVYLLIFIILLINLNGLYAQKYTGSEVCLSCHPDVYALWEASGHVTGFEIIKNNQPPVYPPEVYNFQEQWTDSLGDGSHNWGNIAAVVGGYGWLTRFVGNDGVIIGTASSTYPDAGMGHNQHNFFEGADHGWSDYFDTLQNQYFNYACLKCHTTGADTSGTWLEGVPGMGSFIESGIGCESCHGPGYDHVESGGDYQKIDMVYEFAHQDNPTGGLTVNGFTYYPDQHQSRVNFLCGTCHTRDNTNDIEVVDGFIMHHEQWDEFVSTKHYEFGITCSTCHNPHKRVIWEGDSLRTNCAQCHSEQAEVINHPAGTSCIDCHMPYAAKSGATRGQSGFVADIRSHLMKIIPTTESMFTADGNWVKNDEEREAALSPAFSCMGCHNHDPDDEISDKSLLFAVETAKDMHKFTASVTTHKSLELSVYPNPSRGQVKMMVNLDMPENISIDIYNISGQSVYSMEDFRSSSGKNEIIWDGTSNTGSDIKAGYYFIKISADNVTFSGKMLLLN